MPPTQTRTRKKTTAKSGQGQAKAKPEPTLREQYDDWPFEGGSELPQPWKHAETLPRVGSEEDEVSPVAITHHHPILSHGAGGPAVLELCQLLAQVGYPTSVSKGENPFNNYDATVAQAVESFRDAYDVKEDPHAFGGDHPEGRQLAASHVGPYTWEALERVADR